MESWKDIPSKEEHVSRAVQWEGACPVNVTQRGAGGLEAQSERGGMRWEVWRKV